MTEFTLLCQTDLQAARRLAERAATYWLRSDLKRFTHAQVQAEFRIEGLYTGYADLILSSEKESLIVDWKTTSGSINRSEYQISWQGLLYSWAFKIPDVSYRVMRLDGSAEEIRLRFGEEEWMQAMNHLLGCYRMVEALKHFPVWPSVRIESICKTCEFLKPCMVWDKPHGLPEDPPLPTHLSYSSMRRLLSCPERFRRHLWIADQQERRTWAQEMGLAFEQEISKIYLERFENAEPKDKNA